MISTLRQRLHRARSAIGRILAGDATNIALANARKTLRISPPLSLQRVNGYVLRVTDGPNLYMQFKDEFIRKIYEFSSARPDPLILDGGSNMGMSIIAFKERYPDARIIGFEPDPQIYELLNENLQRNHISGVKLVQAGLGAEEGTTTFTPDHAAGGKVGGASGSVRIRLERLSRYLNEPVEFLKLNIEGLELDVLCEAESSGKLKNVKQLVLEYHGWPSGPQRLGDILNLLDRNGFRYLVHDFDAETNPSSKPPFSWTPQTTWFCLVYAVNVVGVNA